MLENKKKYFKATQTNVRKWESLLFCLDCLCKLVTDSMALNNDLKILAKNLVVDLQNPVLMNTYLFNGDRTSADHIQIEWLREFTCWRVGKLAPMLKSIKMKTQSL